MTKVRWFEVAGTISLALFAGAVLAGCEQRASPTASAPVAETASPALTPVAEDPGWHQIDLGAPPEVNLGGTYAGPAGLVILGGAFGPGGEQGFTWTSRDGLAWQMDETPGLMAPRLGAAIGDVEVVVGTGETVRCAHPFGDQTWSRRDGGEWVAAPFQEVFCAGGNPEIAAGDTSLVIAGSGSGDQPFAWWSDDGSTWHDARQPGDPSPLVRSLTWDGGAFWMVAQDGDTVLLRTSADGARWTGWSPVIAQVGFNPMRLVAVDGQLLLLSSDGTGPVKVWRVSADSTMEAIEATGLDVAWEVAGLTHGASGWLYLLADGPAGPVSLISADGFTWSTVALPAGPGFHPRAAADDGTHVVIIGFTGADVLTWSAWIGNVPARP